jgi:hypothetical protein
VLPAREAKRPTLAQELDTVARLTPAHDGEPAWILNRGKQLVVLAEPAGELVDIPATGTRSTSITQRHPERSAM